MSEIIPETPENESEERRTWGDIIRGLNALSDIDPEFGLYETLDELKDETAEDGLMLLFNYAVAIEVPEGESSELSEVMEMLQEYGLLEGWEEE